MRVILGVLFAVLLAGSASFAIVLPILILVANRTLVLHREDRHVSGMPLLGSILGWLAVLVLPSGTLRSRLPWLCAPIAVEASVLAACVAYWSLSGLRRASKERRFVRRASLPGPRGRTRP
jgi:hypothetical protein